MTIVSYKKISVILIKRFPAPNKKINGPFYAWGSTASCSKPEPLRGGSSLFTEAYLEPSRTFTVRAFLQNC